MRNLFLAIAIITASFAACKKDHVCKCIVSGRDSTNPLAIDSNYSSVTTISGNKKSAQDACQKKSGNVKGKESTCFLD